MSEELARLVEKQVTGYEPLGDKTRDELRTGLDRDFDGEIYALGVYDGALAAFKMAAETLDRRPASDRDAEWSAVIGAGDNVTEPSMTPADFAPMWEEVSAAARDHQECPVWCGDCRQWEKPRSCTRCKGSGCSPLTALGAFDPCGWCDGSGRENVEYRLSGLESVDRDQAVEVAAEGLWRHDTVRHASTWATAPDVVRVSMRRQAASVLAALHARYELTPKAGPVVTLDAKGVNEHGVAMCVCRNAAAQPHAWEPGEACGDRVIPEVSRG